MNWRPIETAPKDGTVVVVGAAVEGESQPSWPVQAYFEGESWKLCCEPWYAEHAFPATHWLPQQR